VPLPAQKRPYWRERSWTETDVARLVFYGAMSGWGHVACCVYVLYVCVCVCVCVCVYVVCACVCVRVLHVLLKIAPKHVTVAVWMLPPLAVKPATPSPPCQPPRLPPYRPPVPAPCRPLTPAPGLRSCWGRSPTLQRRCSSCSRGEVSMVVSACIKGRCLILHACLYLQQPRPWGP
jgi:hypothetical protein